MDIQYSTANTIADRGNFTIDGIHNGAGSSTGTNNERPCLPASNSLSSLFFSDMYASEKALQQQQPVAAAAALSSCDTNTHGLPNAPRCVTPLNLNFNPMMLPTPVDNKISTASSASLYNTLFTYPHKTPQNDADRYGYTLNTPSDSEDSLVSPYQNSRIGTIPTDSASLNGTSLHSVDVLMLKTAEQNQNAAASGGYAETVETSSSLNNDYKLTSSDMSDLFFKRSVLPSFSDLDASPNDTDAPQLHLQLLLPSQGTDPNYCMATMFPAASSQVLLKTSDNNDISDAFDKFPTSGFPFNEIPEFNNMKDDVVNNGYSATRYPKPSDFNGWQHHCLDSHTCNQRQDHTETDGEGDNENKNIHTSNDDNNNNDNYHRSALVNNNGIIINDSPNNINTSHTNTKDKRGDAESTYPNSSPEEMSSYNSNISQIKRRSNVSAKATKNAKSIRAVRHSVSDTKSDKPFKCSLCTSSFTRKTRLTEHINRVHLGKVFHFQCQECGTRLSSKENLTRHSIVHTDKFKCLKCNRRFDRSYRFQRHLEKCHMSHC